MDGIDLALVHTNGKYRVDRGPTGSISYDTSFRKALSAGLQSAKAIQNRDERPGELAELEREITDRHVEAVRTFLEEKNLRLSDIDLIGFHGQTVLHHPNRGLTVQLGLGQELADATGLPVVYDLRANDVANGGQGAPLACAYHRALTRLLFGLEQTEPTVFVNLGGISNLTWISETGSMIAFDAGPANMLIDQWIAAHTDQTYDESGKLARRGQILPGILESYLGASFFDKSPPKSLDRLDFEPLPKGAASLEDGARTMARLAASCLVRACDHLPGLPARWIICGGGSRNPVILEDLTELLAERSPASPPVVKTATELGLNADSVEAEAWAYLAVRSVRGLKITWPGTTGVSLPCTGGVMVHPGAAEKAAANA